MRSALIKVTGETIVAGLVVLMALAGCSGDAPEGASVDGDETTAASPSTSPTASDTATPSSTPKPTNNVESQIYDATVSFYSTVNTAYETLDTGPIKALVVPGSGAAVRYIDYLESVKSKGHRFVVDQGYEVRNFKLNMRDADENSEAATFTLASGSAKEVDANGNTVEEFDPESARLTIEFQKVQGRWLVLSQQ